MKKILIINTNFKHGGAAVVAKKMFYKTKLIFGDEQVFFAYGRGGREDEDNTFYFGNKIELFIHLFLVRFLGLEGYGNFFATYKLLRFIKKEKFNIVHLHNLHGYYINFFWLLKWLNKNNIKVVWTLHDEWVLTWLPAHSSACEHCLGGIGKCVNNYNYPKNYWPIFKKIMLKKKREIFNYHNITFVSPADWLYEKIINRYPNINIKKINNSVNLDLFKPQNKNVLRIKYNLPIAPRIILLSATNFNNKNKGSEYIFDLLKNSSQLNDCLFVSFGKGKIPVSNNLINFGVLTEMKKISDLYALADVFCFPSLAETASLSVLEALASGLPVLAFDIPAHKFIKDYNCGILVKDKSSSALLQELTRLLKDNHKVEAMSISARALAIKEFDENLIFTEYVNLYNCL